MTATEYGVTVRTERLDDTSVVDARRNLEDELERELGESMTIQPPGRKLSASTDAMITLGTVLASNPELAKQLLRTVIDHPRVELKGLSADDRALFTVDVDVDVSGFDVDVTVFEQYKGTTVYEAEEYPEELVLHRLKKQIEQDGTELEYEDYFGDESERRSTGEE